MLNSGESKSQSGANTDPLIGTVLADKYKILGIIGKGGWGVVYHGIHTLMEREVAIKLLKSDFLGDEVNRKRFKLEAQVVSRLNHPNVIGVHDFGMTPEGHHYLVMDLVKGQTLDKILDEDAYLAVDRALPILIQVCAGLSHAHEQGIIHRDLKPGNIMIVPAGDKETAKILDFGVAKVLQKFDSQMEQLTRTGEIFGTSLYLSPEQCMGKQLDERSDIYALGCVMYETFTALPPHVGDNILETLQKHIAEKAVSIREARAELEIPEQLDTIILKALKKDPAERFQSAVELKDALERVRLALEDYRTTSQMAVQEEPQPAPPPETTAVSADATPKTPETTPTPQPVSTTTLNGVKAAPPPGSSSLRLIGMLCIGALLGGFGAWIGYSQLKPNAGPGSAPQAGVTANADNNSVLWKEFNDNGQRYFDGGQYKEAETAFLEAIVLAEKLGTGDHRLLSSLRGLSDMYYAQGRDAEAERIDARIKKLKDGK